MYLVIAFMILISILGNATFLLEGMFLKVIIYMCIQWGSFCFFYIVLNRKEKHTENVLTRYGSGIVVLLFQFKQYILFNLFGGYLFSSVLILRKNNLKKRKIKQ